MEIKEAKTIPYLFVFQYGDAPIDVSEEMKGVPILRDFWLGMERNRPKELQEGVVRNFM